MAGVSHKAGAVERLGKNPLTEVDRALLFELVESMRDECVFGGFDNERRSVAIEFVNMRLKPHMLGAPEIESEGVEELPGPQPDVSVGPYHQIGLEDISVAFADPGINPVGRD